MMGLDGGERWLSSTARRSRRSLAPSRFHGRARWATAALSKGPKGQLGAFCALSGVRTARPRANSGHSLSRFSLRCSPTPVNTCRNWEPPSTGRALGPGTNVPPRGKPRHRQFRNLSQTSDRVKYPYLKKKTSLTLMPLRPMKYLFGERRIVHGPSQHHCADKTGVYGQRSAPRATLERPGTLRVSNSIKGRRPSVTAWRTAGLLRATSAPRAASTHPLPGSSR